MFALVFALVLALVSALVASLVLVLLLMFGLAFSLVHSLLLALLEKISFRNRVIYMINCDNLKYYTLISLYSFRCLINNKREFLAG